MSKQLLGQKYPTAIIALHWTEARSDKLLPRHYPPCSLSFFSLLRRVDFFRVRAERVQANNSRGSSGALAPCTGAQRHNPLLVVSCLFAPKIEKGEDLMADRAEFYCAEGSKKSFGMPYKVSLNVYRVTMAKFRPSPDRTLSAYIWGPRRRCQRQHLPIQLWAVSEKILHFFTFIQINFATKKVDRFATKRRNRDKKWSSEIINETVRKIRRRRRGRKRRKPLVSSSERRDNETRRSAASFSRQNERHEA